jgi:hypothetical protein
MLAAPVGSRPEVVGLGDIIASGPWQMVVEQVTYSPDDTANNWRQASITYTLADHDNRTSRLAIPATTQSPASAPVSPNGGPSFVPVPAAPAPTSADASGLRLYFLDASQRAFGGGFGASEGSFEVVAAPGDALRLQSYFRFPKDSPGPYVVRLAFPTDLGSKVFDVHLDRPAATAAGLMAAAPTGVVPMASPTTLGSDWSISCDGVEFGPAAGPGERPVTVDLTVTNLSSDSRVALTDHNDPTGALRDFYVTDADGNLAYGHSDSTPGVVVPPHAERRVMVRLFTLSLGSNIRPLTFTAVLNWQTNLYAHFAIN